LLVTQINAMQPLSSYSKQAVREVPESVTKIDGALDNYMCVGAPIDGVAKSFARTSRFWKTPPPMRNSVIIVASRASEEEIAPLRKRQLKRWRSQACGTQYQLDWFEGVHSMKAAALRQLAAEAG
jgi:hypothetical protein